MVDTPLPDTITVEGFCFTVEPKYRGHPYGEANCSGIWFIGQSNIAHILSTRIGVCRKHGSKGSFDSSNPIIRQHIEGIRAYQTQRKRGHQGALLRSASVNAFESAASQLQRDCPNCQGIPDHTLEMIQGCPDCKGATKVGITALELAELLADRVLVDLIIAARFACQVAEDDRLGPMPEVIRQLQTIVGKLQPKEAR